MSSPKLTENHVKAANRLFKGLKPPADLPVSEEAEVFGIKLRRSDLLPPGVAMMTNPGSPDKPVYIKTDS